MQQTFLKIPVVGSADSGSGVDRLGIGTRLLMTERNRQVCNLPI